MTAPARPLVVISGKINPAGIKQLESEARVVITPDQETKTVIELAREAEGILFRAGPRCDDVILDACPHVRVVGRHGVGLDTVDLDSATRHGVAVVHAPGSNSQAVAEHALMLMLACVKRTVEIDRMTRKGDWTARHQVVNTELAGKTLGIVGVGNIGRRVARFAGAIGMRVLGYDKYVPADEIRRRGAEPVGSLDELLPQVDILTCHTPLTPETRHMIDERALGRMKPGAIFINTSRGPVHSERAVFEALVQKRLAAAGLDVFEQEPSPVDNPLFNLDTVVCSGHVAGVTVEANKEASLQVTAEIMHVLRGERPEVLANPDVWPRPAHRR
jgi:D-3-phosphoglycerate dehydrogenase